MTYSSLLNVCAKAGDYLSLGGILKQKVEKKIGAWTRFFHRGIPNESKARSEATRDF